MNKTENSQEYDRFTATMDKLMKVPHSKLKAKLGAEKRAKEEKKPSKT